MAAQVSTFELRRLLRMRYLTGRAAAIAGEPRPFPVVDEAWDAGYCTGLRDRHVGHARVGGTRTLMEFRDELLAECRKLNRLDPNYLREGGR